jgi:dolichol-phosphate mannosyltransferase
MDESKKCISIITPVYNEEKNVLPFFEELQKVLDSLPYQYHFEIIFVDDGSTDRSLANIRELETRQKNVRHIELSRNFGKEAATTAGIHASVGDAVICIDADLQHPPEIIPSFIDEWERGAEIVIGIRRESKSDMWFRRIGSAVFYRIMNMISETTIVPHETDFRLIDRIVVKEFNRLTEHNRMTRGLIDWLGFKRQYVHFDARARKRGTPSYSTFKLIELAFASFISHSLLPLRLAGYLGVVITVLAGVLGVVMFTDRYVVSWGLNFSGPAILAGIILFLVGITLTCIGLLAFYIGNIHTETQNRPLYIARKK